MHDQLICTNGDNFVCNVQAEDIHTHNCKEYISSTAAGWEDRNDFEARVKCIEEGGRLMRITSMADIKFLSQASGQDGPGVSGDPYHMHAVSVMYSHEVGDWKSYHVAIDINLWSASSSMGEFNGLECSFLVVEPGNDYVNDRYRLGEFNCGIPRPFICERPRTVHNTGPAWTYDQQDTCNHWFDSTDGKPAMVDQEYFETFKVIIY